MVKLAKQIFEKKLAKDIKLNPKQFWSFVRSRTRVKENVLRIKKRNGMMTEDDFDTANILNRAFRSVFVKENAMKPIPSLNLDYNGPVIEDIEVDLEMVDKKATKYKYS